MARARWRRATSATASGVKHAAGGGRVGAGVEDEAVGEGDRGEGTDEGRAGHDGWRSQR